MKVVYEAANNIEAYLLKSRLEYEQILSWITGEYLQGGVGDLQVHGLARVMVTDEDAERAMRVIRDYENEVYSGLAPVEFFVTGVDSAETARLTDILAPHPCICLLISDRMELTAATASRAEHKAGYHRQFRHCRHAAVRIESNPAYFSDVQAINSLRRYNPEAKVVGVVREQQQSGILTSKIEDSKLLLVEMETLRSSAPDALNIVYDFLGVDPARPAGFLKSAVRHLGERIKAAASKLTSGH